MGKVNVELNVIFVCCQDLEFLLLLLWRRMELVLGLMTGFNVIEDNAFALLKEQLLCTIIHYMVKVSFALACKSALFLVHICMVCVYCIFYVIQLGCYFYCNLRLMLFWPETAHLYKKEVTWLTFNNSFVLKKFTYLLTPTFWTVVYIVTP